MFDAWMNIWTDRSETVVTAWTAANDAVPSVTDGVAPMWLTSMATPVLAPMMFGAATFGAVSATWAGLAMAMPQAGMAMAGLQPFDAPPVSPAKPKTSKAPANKASAANKAPAADKAPATNRTSAKAAADTASAVANSAKVASETAPSKRAAPKPAAAKSVSAKTVSAETNAVKPISGVKAAAKAKTAKTKTAKTTPNKTATKPATATSQKTPTKSAVDDRPAGLAAPRFGKADDLKRIAGVGPKLETTLNDMGIYHFDQIAAWTPNQIDWVDNYLRFPGRIARDNWIAQASTFATQQA